MKLNNDLFKKFTSANSSVRYWLYHGKEFDRYIDMPEYIHDVTPKKKNTNSACFAALKRDWKNSDSTYDRIYYEPTSLADSCGPFAMTNEVRKRWLHMCRQYNLLPEYVDIERCLKKAALVLDLTAHSFNQLYMYLSVFRFLADEPGHVGSILTLVDEYKMNFIAAMVLSMQVSMGNSNHHFLPSQDCVYLKDAKWDLNNTTVNLGSLVGLYRLIHRHDEVSLENNGAVGFRCNCSIQSGSRLATKMTVPMLLHPMVGALIAAKNDKEVSTFLNIMKKTTARA